MKFNLHGTAILACLLLALGLAGCDREESLGEQIEESAEGAGDNIEDAAEEAGDKMEDTAEKAEDKLD